jgi:hypothetical protein
MSYWSPLRIDGVDVDLSHLEPFEFSIVPKGSSSPATISVSFHDHCFTETFDPSRHARPLTLPLSSRHEQRAFDPDRHALSKRLPDIVRELDGQRIAGTDRENLVKITLADGRDYGVFFTLRRESARRCGLFVVSAYILDRPRQSVVRTGEMRFNVAVAIVLANRRLRFPGRS